MVDMVYNIKCKGKVFCKEREDVTMKDKKSMAWLQVTNKKTYLFLVLAVCCISFLIGDAVYVFAMKQREAASFVSDAFISVMLLLMSVYFFVRFNTYSHIYNPEHPKPEYHK